MTERTLPTAAFMRAEVKTLIRENFTQLLTAVYIVSLPVIFQSLLGLLLPEEGGSTGLNILISAFTGFLQLGLSAGLVETLRSHTALEWRCVLSRRADWVRAAGLVLARLLWTFLWVLPGAVMLVAGSASAMVLAVGAAEVSADLSGVGAVMAGAGLLGILWVIFALPRCLLTYAHCFFVQAEDDTIGAMECIRRSKALVKGRFWRLAGVLLPGLLASVGLILLSALLKLPALITTILMPLTLVYFHAGTAVFYRESTR